MCRIFYNPSSSINFTEDDLLRFFLSLEKESGGDGNGVYRMNSGKLEKSVATMPNTDIEEPFLYHTRNATHGEKKDYNVQPFRNGRYVLVHNGIFSYADKPSFLLGLFNNDKYSDSYKIHYIIKKVGISKFYATFIKSSYGVILIHDKEVGLTYLLKTSGIFRAAKIRGEYIYGSSQLDFWEIDEDFGTELIDDGMYILKADEIIKIHTPETITYTHAYNRYQNYGRGWYAGDNDDYYGYYEKLNKKYKKNKQLSEPDQEDEDQEVVKIRDLFDNTSLFHKYSYDLFRCYECDTIYSNLELGGYLSNYPFCKSCFLAYHNIKIEDPLLFDNSSYFKCDECGCYYINEDLGGRRGENPICIKCLEKESGTAWNNKFFKCDECKSFCSNLTFGAIINSRMMCEDCLEKSDKKSAAKCFCCGVHFFNGEDIYIDEDGELYCVYCAEGMDIEDMSLITYEEYDGMEKGL